MPRVRVHKFTVTQTHDPSGIGPLGFPFDMLRYDQAWPADNEAAFAMASQHALAQPVTLLSNNPPTEKRWLSFGFTVEHHEGYKRDV